MWVRAVAGNVTPLGLRPPFVTPLATLPSRLTLFPG